MMEVNESAAEKSSILLRPTLGETSVRSVARTQRYLKKKKKFKAVLRSGVEAQTNTNNEANYQPIGLLPK